MRKYAASIEDIRAAAERIEGVGNGTPIRTSKALDELAGRRLFFKCENFQKVGAFKFRGACNTVFSLSDEKAERGVGTHSSGNHAAAVALAAKLRGIKAHVVMPNNAPEIKKKAVMGYGAEITYCEPTLKARETTLESVIEKTGAVEIHPFDDPRVISGQGTAALELMDEIDDLDAILAPVGGGGLICGTAIAVAGMGYSVSVFAAEPKNADDAYQSFKSGKFVPQTNPDTMADGLLTSLSELTLSIIMKYVSDIFTVTEEEIITAMQTVWERMKIIIEPSSAVPVAVVLNQANDLAGKKVGVILTGGNVDLEKLRWS